MASYENKRLQPTLPNNIMVEKLLLIQFGVDCLSLKLEKNIMNNAKLNNLQSLQVCKLKV